MQAMQLFDWAVGSENWIQFMGKNYVSIRLDHMVKSSILQLIFHFLGYFQATGHDGFVPHWYHLDCIFLSPYVPQFLKDIGNLYLIKYADQVRIIKNIGLPYDPNCDLEIEVKAQNDELFAFKETIQTFKKKQLKEFFYHNSYPTPRGQQLTVISDLIKFIFN